MTLSAAWLASVLAVTGALSAQTTVPVRSGQTSAETVELSPFIVTETGESGWVATETLAGTRLRTDLKDVPSQIETLTKEFMQDLGLNDVDAALIYSANTDNQNIGLSCLLVFFFSFSFCIRCFIISSC